MRRLAQLKNSRRPFVKNKKKDAARATGCCLLTLLYLPFGIVAELTKKYNQPRRRR